MRRRRRWLAAALLAGVALGGVAAVMTLRDRSSDRPQVARLHASASSPPPAVEPAKVVVTHADPTPEPAGKVDTAPSSHEPAHPSPAPPPPHPDVEAKPAPSRPAVTVKAHADPTPTRRLDPKPTTTSAAQQTKHVVPAPKCDPMTSHTGC